MGHIFDAIAAYIASLGGWLLKVAPPTDPRNSEVRDRRGGHSCSVDGAAGTAVDSDARGARFNQREPLPDPSSPITDVDGGRGYRPDVQRPSASTSRALSSAFLPLSSSFLFLSSFLSLSAVSLFTAVMSIASSPPAASAAGSSSEMASDLRFLLPPLDDFLPLRVERNRHRQSKLSRGRIDGASSRQRHHLPMAATASTASSFSSITAQEYRPSWRRASWAPACLDQESWRPRPWRPSQEPTPCA